MGLLPKLDGAGRCSEEKDRAGAEHDVAEKGYLGWHVEPPTMLESDPDVGEQRTARHGEDVQLARALLRDQREIKTIMVPPITNHPTTMIQVGIGTSPSKKQALEAANTVMPAVRGDGASASIRGDSRGTRNAEQMRATIATPTSVSS